MQDSLDDKKAKVMNQLLSTLINDPKANKDTEVAYAKGFVDGLRWASSAPRNAAGAHKRLLAKEGNS